MLEGHYAKQENETISNDLGKDNWGSPEHVYLSLKFNQF